MNKNAIQKYALWARKELIEQVKQRAYQYGIDESGFEDPDAIIVRGRVLSNDEKRQRKDFIRKINASGFEQAIEEVAYTWFNRFIALRFMEVNDYLPSHIRVFSDASGSFKPEILQDVLHLDLDGLDKAKVAQLLNANKTEELYRYLLLTQCNALNAALTEMFEQLGSYTEMLFPNNILRQESVLAHLVNDIDEDDWKDAVQIIGWMYQYYNTEPKQAVFDGLKKNVKISKENIPAATQLFTPDWIVRYMVENSLGRLWLESHPNATALKSNWKYYLDEAEQSPQVAEQLRLLRSQSAIKSPEDIKLIDPCMGSGHILVYAFDVLMQIYESEGYNPRDAAKLILEKNLYGLDIDRRAYQLAYFALMMKARQHNRRIFSEDLKPQLYYPAGFPDGEEYGSLVKVDQLPAKPERFLPDGMTYNPTYEIELNAWNFQRLLAQKYDVVVTNPPYMGSQGMNVELSDYVKENYPDSKSDLFAVFIEKCGELLRPMGYQAMITQHAWMFITSYEKLRHKLMTWGFVNMAHLGARAFEDVGGEVVQTTAFVLAKQHTANFEATYVRLVDYGNQDAKEKAFLSGNERYLGKIENFEKIPGSPIAYQFPEHIFSLFANSPSLSDIALTRLGITTADNEKFVRHWSEVDYPKVAFIAKNSAEVLERNSTWAAYNKGGKFRKWYGNLEHVVYWKDDGYAIKNFGAEAGHIRSTVANTEYFFRPCLTWSKISSGNIAFRFRPTGSIFDVAGACLFGGNQEYLLGILNSKVCMLLLAVLAPTLNFEGGQISSIPIIEERSDVVQSIVRRNISISRTDWDAFETSWDFKRHPLI